MAVFALLTCWTIVGLPLFLILRRRQIDKVINLKRQAGMTVADKKAWYNTNAFWFSILCYPIFPVALTLRLIDKKRISKDKSPLKWQSKTIFFALSFVAIMLISIARNGLLSLPSMTFSIWCTLKGLSNTAQAGSASQSKSNSAVFSQWLPYVLVSPNEATQSGAQ